MQQRPSTVRSGVLRAKAVLVLLAAGLVLLRWISSTPPVPVDIVQTNYGWADESTCIDCHRDVVDAYQENGHLLTLTRADAPASTRLLERLSVKDPFSGGKVTVDRSGTYPIAVHRTENEESRLVLDWCFGSGHHARTWVGTLPGSWGETDMVEFRWTWYALTDDFAITPGQEEVSAPGHFAELGSVKDPSRARRCFACHASYIAIRDGRIDQQSLVAGIQCQRCHGPMQDHVQQARRGDGKGADPFWRSATALESINRCGQCHRRADEFRPEQIRPDNVVLARFQPIGLSQSPCFQKSEKLTCMTCHDPHLPLSKQDSKGDWQCLQCHDPKRNRQAHPCAAGNVEDCLRCHMPKVKQDAPLEFTDHWIRVRDDIKEQ